MLPAPSSKLHHDAHPLIAQIRDDAMRHGQDLARLAADSGLAVTEPDGSVRPIPIGALPMILSDEEIALRRVLAGRLVSATAKAARWQMSGPLRRSVLNALSAAEQRLVDATWRQPQDLAVARVDFLIADQPQALEVNTTIPAMQGYSDIASESWLASFAAGRSDLAALIAANGSNARALLDALVSLYAVRRGDELLSVGLLCRRGDAQLTELHYLQQRFRQAGLDASIVHPDELVLRRGYLEHAGRRLQLIYRHLFISRLDRQPSPDVEAALMAHAPASTLVLNPPTPHLEMKSTLALLSSVMASSELIDAIGLDDTECRAITESVPWTRQLVSGDDGDCELLSEINAHPNDFVLKRSWSYGGNEVFVGRAQGNADFWGRVHAIYPDIHNWAALCERAATDTRGGGFIVQRAVASSHNEQFLCTPTTVQRAHVTTDYAAYASLGVQPAWSGVCRASVSDVVNIVGGGAVVPIIRRSVADRLTQRVS